MIGRPESKHVRCTNHEWRPESITLMTTSSTSISSLPSLTVSVTRVNGPGSTEKDGIAIVLNRTSVNTRQAI
jgi:hypothetical protein